MKKIVSFFAGMIFMIIFGIIDNAFLVFGMDVNTFVDPHTNPMLSAMWGNTFSDVIGAVAGVVVSWAFKRMFKVKPMDHIMVEIAGVFVGCIIPILIMIIF